MRGVKITLLLCPLREASVKPQTLYAHRESLPSASSEKCKSCTLIGISATFVPRETFTPLSYVRQSQLYTSVHPAALIIRRLHRLTKESPNSNLANTCNAFRQNLMTPTI